MFHHHFSRAKATFFAIRKYPLMLLNASRFVHKLQKSHLLGLPSHAISYAEYKRVLHKAILLL